MNRLKVMPNTIEYPIPLGVELNERNYYVDGHTDIFTREYFKTENTFYIRKYENQLVIYKLNYIENEDNLIFSERPLLELSKHYSKKSKTLVTKILDETFFDKEFDVTQFIKDNIYNNSLLNNYNKYLFESFMLEVLEESYFADGVLENIEKNGTSKIFFCKILELYLNNQELLLEFIFRFKLFNSFAKLLDNKISLSNFVISKEKQKVCYPLLILLKEKFGIEALEEINSISMFSNDEIKLIEVFFVKVSTMLEKMNYSPSKYLTNSISEIFEILTHTKLVKQTLDYYVEQLFSKFWIVSSGDFFTNYVDYLRIASYIKELNEEYIYSYYPKDIQVEHDKTSKMYTNLVKNDNNKYSISEIKSFKTAVSKYINLEYSNEEYSIIVPKSITEVINEGDKLDHCVAGYVKLIAAKTSQICFLRKNNDKEKSYLTLEVKNNNICQGKKFKNELPNKKDIEFIEEWSKIKELKIKRF